MTYEALRTTRDAPCMAATDGLSKHSNLPLPVGAPPAGRDYIPYSPRVRGKALISRAASCAQLYLVLLLKRLQPVQIGLKSRPRHMETARGTQREKTSIPPTRDTLHSSTQSIDDIIEGISRSHPSEVLPR